jgi:magnesium transporter
MSKLHGKRHKRQRRLARTMSAHTGRAPGIISVDPESPKPEVQVLCYGPDEYVETANPDFATIKDMLPKWPVTWINVDGLGDAELLRAYAIEFNLHRLSMEDVTSLYQRPKLDVFDDHLFIIVRQPNLPHALGAIETEQLNIFVGPNVVITFQDRPGDCLGDLRDRIRNKVGRTRIEGADYLAYAIIDAVIDAYFPLLEEYSGELELLEESVVESPSEQTAAQILHVKRNLLGLRRVCWPLREVVNTLLRESTPFIGDTTRTYLKDGYDHIIHILDLVEVERELVTGLLDVYLSSLSNRLNDVMRVLTIISTVFIPLTFIVGVYGMNFDPKASPYNMPEIEWRYGYPAVWAFMILTAVMLLGFFIRKGWMHSFVSSRTKVVHHPESDEGLSMKHNRPHGGKEVH